ncbi:hypothetical protein PATA110615_14435 [Paenibacillus taichungensis]
MQTENSSLLKQDLHYHYNGKIHIITMKSQFNLQIKIRLCLIRKCILLSSITCLIQKNCNLAYGTVKESINRIHLKRFQIEFFKLRSAIKTDNCMIKIPLLKLKACLMSFNAGRFLLI